MFFTTGIFKILSPFFGSRHNRHCNFCTPAHNGFPHHLTGRIVLKGKPPTQPAGSGHHDCRKAGRLATSIIIPIINQCNLSGSPTPKQHRATITQHLLHAGGKTKKGIKSTPICQIARKMEIVFISAERMIAYGTVPRPRGRKTQNKRAATRTASQYIDHCRC